MGNAPTLSHWYDGVTRYQWTVLAIASAGWVFDVFEGQLFVACMNKAMDDLVGNAPGEKAYYTNIALAAFLLGGAVGGILFGSLADRIGRRRTLTLTILMYSVFTAATYFAQRWWDLAILRFLVAMGVGGEWAVAAAVVAEEFSKRSRPTALGIFHASSVLGTYLAVLVGSTIVVMSWRAGFLVGALPALLVVWIRFSMHESERWQTVQAGAIDELGKKLGSFRDLFATATLRRNALVGTGLAAIGMATFWGVHIYGKDLVREARLTHYAAELYDNPQNPQVRRAVAETHAAQLQRWEMLGMLVATTGGGLGLLAFAPLTQRTNRRFAFLLFHLGGFAIVLATFQFVHEMAALLLVLPLFGFLTLGMHAGYAIYFPELFPTRLRGSGGGFCFNIGRVLAAPALFAVGWMQTEAIGLNLRSAASLMGLLYLVGALLLLWAPETKGEELPE